MVIQCKGRCNADVLWGVGNAQTINVWPLCFSVWVDIHFHGHGASDSKIQISYK